LGDIAALFDGWQTQYLSGAFWGLGKDGIGLSEGIKAKRGKTSYHADKIYKDDVS
jgi:hypothetical protein